MPADTDVEASGSVIDLLPGGKFKVRLENDSDIIAHLSGRMRVNSIKIVAGDRVQIAMSPYDLTKGRITRRF